MIWESIRNQGWGRTPAKIGLAGLFLSLIFARNWRNARGGAGASLTGVFAAVFTCIIFMVTPFDLRWHLASALQRLIAHQWFLLALGGVLLSAKAGR